MKKAEVLGINVSVGSYDALLSKVIKVAKEKRHLSIAPVAVHALVVAKLDSGYKMCLNSLDLVLPDSYWHLWVINFLYRLRLKERFYGPYLMKDLIKIAKKEGLNVYLFGGSGMSVLDNLEKWFKKVGPGEGEMYKYKASFSIDDKELDTLAKNVKRQGLGILFIGLSTPLQHEVLGKLESKINIPVVATGAAFDFYSGAKKQAPKWMHNAGLEWLFRLIDEPTRLWKRYLVYNPLFLFFIFIQKLRLSLGIDRE